MFMFLFARDDGFCGMRTLSSWPGGPTYLMEGLIVSIHWRPPSGVLTLAERGRRRVFGRFCQWLDLHLHWPTARLFQQ